jgi:AcrR family transcriptional regulator
VARLGNPTLPEQLFECTTQIIRERGLAFVSLRAVARRARVSHGAPAYYFPNKAALLSAYAARGYRLLAASVREMVARTDGDARDRLEAIGVAYVRFALAQPEQFGMMFRAELHRRGDRALREAADGAWCMLADTLARCAAEGYLPREEVEMVTAAAWAIAHGLAVLLLTERLPSRVAVRDRDRVSAAVLHRFVRSMLPPPQRPRAHRHLRR